MDILGFLGYYTPARHKETTTQMVTGVSCRLLTGGGRGSHNYFLSWRWLGTVAL